MLGGDLHLIWKPYEIYQEVDYVRTTLPMECWCGYGLTWRVAVCI